MVSIFANEVYNETITVSFDDNARAPSEFENKVNFPTVSMDNVLGDFTYIITANLSFSFDQQLNLTGPNDSNQDQRIAVNPVFNFNNIDLFQNIEVDVIETRYTDFNQDFSMPTSGIATTTVDKYADVPADLEYNVRTFTTSSGESRINGNQTRDLTGTLEFIGRQP
jgi:hypothetical protein